MSEANLYGQIIDADAVEGAMVATLNVWLDAYLGELERLKGYEPNQIARPRGIITASEFAKWNEDQLPVILVVSPGLNGTPITRKGDGTYEAVWSVTVCPIVADVNAIQSRRLASAYAAAIRAAITQHKGLTSPLHPDGFSNFLSWVDESYGDIPFDDTRALDSARVVFDVGVEGVVTERAGLRVPPEDPALDPGDWPGVSDVAVTTESVRTLP